MCFDTNLQDQLKQQLVVIDREMTIDARKSQGPSGVSDNFRHLCEEKRETQRRLAAIPHRFYLGDGCSAGGNGDSHPYRVVAVSASGKTIKVVPMGYSVHPRSANMGYGGHDDWIVYDDLTTLEDIEANMITVTLRSNGKWAKKGTSSKGSYGNFQPGARYSYNWMV